MKMRIKRLISLLLIFTMVLTIFPLEVFAADLKTGTNSPFKDVNQSDWFYDAALYAKEKGIFNGTGSDTFAPQGAMTRAMYVTMLAKIAGIDITQYQSTQFSDIAAGAWYGPYAEWAAKNGITTGTGNGRFSPNLEITREQMATLTVRYFKKFNVPFGTGERITTAPKDFDSVSPWARDAVLLLWQGGLFQGDANGNFNPVSRATRGEAVVFGMRTSETVRTGDNSTVAVTTPLMPQTPKFPPLDTLKEPSDERVSANNYTITFITNGGDTISNWSLQEGSRLNNLPIPYKVDSIFTGWYKQSNLTEPVDENDRLTRNMTLYAEYSAVEAINEIEIVPYVSKLDQGDTFSIGIDTEVNMTTNEVQELITFQSLTNPDFAGVNVIGANKHFTIEAIGGKFEAGGAYKLLLNDDRLSFTGENPSSSIYNFTVVKPEILNLGLAEGMKYIPAAQVNGMTLNGTSVSQLSVPVARASNDGTNLSMVEVSQGTFTYNGPALLIGDHVAIYEGISPAARTLNTTEADSGAVAYVTITAVNGTTYTYENTDSKDVLFTPDLLPVSNTADQDGVADNFAAKVSKDEMTYTSFVYSEMGLSADTTVDIGDFIAFYSGDFSTNPAIIQYARITQVSTINDDYLLNYVHVTEDVMKAAMELSSEKDIEGDQLLEDVDVSELEKQVEQQAISSGFANESAQYLASLALKTDSFKKIDQSIDLQQVNLRAEDLSALASGDMILVEDQEVELENLKVDVEIGTNLKHFDNLKGVRCVLNVSFDIVIHTDKSDIVIKVTGKFEEEVRIVIKATGGAVWKKKGLFPYVKDYRIHASIDAYNYTGVKIDATIGTFKKSDSKSEWANPKKYEDIAAQLKTLMDNKAEGMDSVSDTLVEKYSKMLATKSDWVTLIDKSLFDNEYFADPYHILVYGVKVNFVVAANMNASIGCEFTYENAKRYIFTLGIYSGTSSSDTISLVEGKYKFTAYIMGSLGLKAGIKIELATGLFSLKLGSIGFIAEVGAYLKLWGYFFYELNYMDSVGKTSKSSGALFIEIGIYLKISFKAQAIKGKFKYNPTLYENEWPLLFFGSQKNVHDFSYAPVAAPKISMAKSVMNFTLPDSLFKMSYMDMKTGVIEQETFDDAKDFKIKISNADFSYDPALNLISVNPGSKLVSDGKMTITWKAAPLAFTSEPISRTLLLHWENLKDTYSISFNSKGGSAVQTVVLPYNSSLMMPVNPTKEGFAFSGWYLDANCTQPYNAPAKMTSEDVTLYAKWNPTNTIYTVEHYQQNLVNSLYTLTETQVLTGTTSAELSPEPRIYNGFTAPKPQNITLMADGSTIVKYYYSRNSYTLTFNLDNGTAPQVEKIKFGGAFRAPEVTKAGYLFVSWSSEVAQTMPSQDLTYVAQWKPSDLTPYRVEHYQQNIDNDQYSLFEATLLTGTTNTLVTGAEKVYAGFTFDSDVENTVTSGNVEADGSLVLKLYYKRNKHTLVFNANSGVGGTSTEVKYGTAIFAPQVTKLGYTLSAWSPALAATMPNQDVTYTAQWTPSTTTPFKIEHYQENIENDLFTLVDTDNLTGTTLALVTTTAKAKAYEGFSFDSGVADSVLSGNVAADGSLVLKLYYKRNKHTLEFNANSGVGGTSTEVKYGTVILAPQVTKMGYTLSSWSPTLAATMPDQDVTYTAQWTASTNTSYIIQHYQQNIENDLFTLVDTDNLTGTTLALVTTTAKAKAYEGFTFDSGVAGSVLSGNVAANGSLVLKMYYTRNLHTLKFDANGGNGGTEAQVKYGAAIVAPVVTKGGYSFSVWSPALVATMPDQNLTHVAQWVEGSNVQYTVEHYQQNSGNDNFSLAQTENLTGTTNALVTATSKVYEGFTFDNAVVGSVLSGNVAANGSLVLKVYYTRNLYTLTFDANGGSDGTQTQVKYGTNISAPVVTRVGYDFTIWQPNVAASMPASDTTYTAQWTASSVPVGAGTLADPYQVGTYANLAWIAQQNVAQAGFSGKYFKQTADIDMSITSTESWLPIGDNTVKFSGAYDGNGFSVEHLTISSNNVRLGLFGVIDVNAKVSDLGVTDANITCTLVPNTTGALTGALAGTLYGTVERCYSTGTVTGDGNTGGLIGYSYGGTIVDSYSRCSVIGNGTSNAVAWDQLGGLLGKMAKVTGRTGFVSTSYATGNVNGPNHDQVAGLVGEIDTDQEVYSSFSTGVPTGTANVGGIIGVLQGPMYNAYTTQNSFVGNAGTVTGGLKNLALEWFKTVGNFTTAANWHGTHLWDFVNTWAVDPAINDGLPYLKKSKLGR